MTTSLARAERATRSFGELLAVDHVDLDVAPREIVGLLGANGAGKTTLIRLLLGLLPVTAGSVSLFGTRPSRETRTRLGYVPQGLGLYDDLTPQENLQFARAAFGAGGSATTVSQAAVPVGELSLGTRRRVAFAQALDHRPELLVLDEPTSGVDPLGRARLWEMLRDATDAGAGALVTTHHMDEAEECDRLVVMAGGAVVADGTIRQIVGGATAVVVECEDWTRAFDALESAGLRVALVGRSLRVPGADESAVRGALGGVRARVETRAATLEEKFLELALSGTRSG